jgi:hypothetical protein
MFKVVTREIAAIGRHVAWRWKGRLQAGAWTRHTPEGGEDPKWAAGPSLYVPRFGQEAGIEGLAENAGGLKIRLEAPIPRHGARIVEPVPENSCRAGLGDEAFKRRAGRPMSQDKAKTKAFKVRREAA